MLLNIVAGAIVLPEFRMDLPSKYTTSEKSLFLISHNYVCIQLLYKNFNAVTGHLILFTHGIAEQFSLVCNFILIKEWNTSNTYLLVSIFSIIYFIREINDMVSRIKLK